MSPTCPVVPIIKFQTIRLKPPLSLPVTRVGVETETPSFPPRDKGWCGRCVSPPLHELDGQSGKGPIVTRELVEVMVKVWFPDMFMKLMQS